MDAISTPRLALAGPASSLPTRTGDVVAEWDCPVCDRPFAVIHRPGRPRLYCSSACRQRAYRWRRDHGIHTVIERGVRVLGGKSGVMRGFQHALRTERDPMSRRRDHRAREVTVCGALVRPGRTSDTRLGPPYTGYRPDAWNACRTCAALTVPRPLGLVPPGAFTERPDRNTPLDPPDLLDEILEEIVRRRSALYSSGAYRPTAA